MNAMGRENTPSNSSKPPPNSRIPARPGASVNSFAEAISVNGPAGRLNNLSAPWHRNRNAATMRRMLSSCGAALVQELLPAMLVLPLVDKRWGLATQTGPWANHNTKWRRRPASLARSAAAQRLHVFDGFRERGGQHLATARAHRHVVLDADAQPAPLRRYRGVVGRDVDAGFHRRHHAGFQHARLVVDPVIADVVHVQPDPMARLVRKEALVVTRFQRRARVARQQLQRTQAVGDHAR